MGRQTELRERFHQTYVTYVTLGGRLHDLLVTECTDGKHADAIATYQAQLRTAKQEYEQAEHEYVAFVLDSMMAMTPARR